MSALSRRTALIGAGALVTACAGRSVAGSGDLKAVVDRAMADRATSMLIARGDDVRAERYAPGWPADRPREVASVAKSMMAVLFGMAIEDGAIAGLDQSAADFIPAWKDDARAGITLHHLLSMTSGLDDTGLALRGVTGDQFAINAAARLAHPPGTRWAYNTAAYHLLFHILMRATGETIEAYAERKLLGPLGMADTVWVTSQGQGQDGPVTNYYSAASTARDLWAFGRMVMQGGAWQGRQLVPADYVTRMVTASQPINRSYGLLWWVNAEEGLDVFGRPGGRRFPNAPHDTCAALGAGGQVILIVPSRDLIIVRQGDPPASADFADRMLADTLAVIG
ncbi:MAG: beta-lactamase family protein [Alphaproteobacteria bacterium]|nr:beta-lactamase family protein [Alphaproteobacteria bacterium]